jgi:TRAP-type C4-dicarboxylate transport system permease large subunit
MECWAVVDSSPVCARSESTQWILYIVVLALQTLGSFVEAVPVVLIAVPMFGPLVVKFGIDTMHCVLC